MTKKINIVIIYIILFAVIVLGNICTFSIFDVRVKLSEILCVIAFPFVIGMHKKLRKSNKTNYMLLWTLLSLILILYNFFKYQYTTIELLNALLYLFRFIYTLSLAPILGRYCKEYYNSNKILKFINYCYLLVCVLGVVILILFPVARDFYQLLWNVGLVWDDYDPHINRLFSTYLDPNFCACCINIGLSISLYYFLKIKNNKRKKAIYFIYSLFYVICIFLTRSRSGFLCMAFVLFGYLYAWLRKYSSGERLLVYLVVLLVAVILIEFSNINIFVRLRSGVSDGSSQHRFNSWKTGFETILINPLGIGYNFTGPYFGSSSGAAGNGLDSSLLLILMTSGILGFVLYFLHLYDIYRCLNSTIFKALFIGSIVVSFFNNLLLYFIWMVPFYFVLMTVTKQNVSEKYMFNYYKKRTTILEV